MVDALALDLAGIASDHEADLLGCLRQKLRPGIVIHSGVKISTSEHVEAEAELPQIIQNHFAHSLLILDFEPAPVQKEAAWEYDVGHHAADQEVVPRQH